MMAGHRFFADALHCWTRPRGTKCTTSSSLSDTEPPGSFLVSLRRHRVVEVTYSQSVLVVMGEIM